MRKETVRDFIRTYDKNLTPNSSLWKLNRGLRECGLVPIRFRPDSATIIIVFLMITLVVGNTLLPFHRTAGFILLASTALCLIVLLIHAGIMPNTAKQKKRK